VSTEADGPADAQAPEAPPSEPTSTVADDDDLNIAPSGQWVNDNVRAGRDLFQGCRVTIDQRTTLTDAGRLLVPTIDITTIVAELRDRFVEPPFQLTLRTTLAEKRIALLIGQGAGKRTAAAHAMHEAGHAPILLIPGEAPTKTLVDTIDHACNVSPRAGVVVEWASLDTLNGLSGTELDRLRSALGTHAVAVLTARARPEGRLRNVPVIEGEPPAAGVLVEAFTASDDVRARANEALGYLEPPIAPGTVLTLVERAAETDLDAARLAAEFASNLTDKALEEWLAPGRSSREIASLAAAAALEGAPIHEIDRHARSLRDALEPPVKATTEAPVPKVFGAVDRGWPADVVRVGRGTSMTHFDLQEVDVVELCRPHTRDRTTRWLWRTLGPDFRGPFVEWLSELATSGELQVRFGAAFTAGTLFVDDARYIEGTLLRPWALSEQTRCRHAAAIALSVPTALGADTSTAHKLANSWGSTDNVFFRDTVVRAYGSWLGSTDTAAIAVGHLWRIGEQTPELRPHADVALARLVAAGAEAATARATVVALLTTLGQHHETRGRMLLGLPIVIKRLTNGDRAARASLEALLGPDERPTAEALCALLLSALLGTAASKRSATLCLQVLLAASQEGRIDEDHIAEFIRTMKDVAPSPSELDLFRVRLNSLLMTESRRRRPRRDAALAILRRFFPQSVKEAV
jgi:hypothetical protein